MHLDGPSLFVNHVRAKKDELDDIVMNVGAVHRQSGSGCVLLKRTKPKTRDRLERLVSMESVLLCTCSNNSSNSAFHGEFNLEAQFGTVLGVLRSAQYAGNAVQCMGHTGNAV